MSRVFNFSAGPAVLPEEVLMTARDELLEYGTSGMSVMEMSHRSKDFEDILFTAEKDLRTLMNIPDNYRVLFLQGGGYTQFAMIPMNLMINRVADYIVTGQWSKKAASEAKIFGTVNVIADSSDRNYSYVPDLENLNVSDNADYVYICQNETVHGTTIKTLPNTKGKVLVADISSMFLSQPLNVKDYGVIMGGVQKNVGPAGLAIVIIRDDLIRDDVLEFTPTMMKYKTHADAKSLFNTPPCYNIYICGLVFKWLIKLGG
ncbi:MAG: 3-phosphoserine/phosphohydroxythreonine transaminase, partial [Synergistaceae bacterium]|nr:3-phosphoserine/phosphohydroxythreonine transaminase [Synergistaceae bacterium]